jgi:2-polyprenyl-6-methoxyphenol hydroxylase-like FAD-dependent oxidoreductase
MAKYDIVTVGGGLGGAALAKATAERGRSVLVIERETAFKDRVRGEGMTPWGVAEARDLGVYDLLAGCGQEVPWWDNYVGPMQVVHRELKATTPQGMPTLTFHHPTMQETMLAAAVAAGAEARRGAKALAIMPGKEPQVRLTNPDGSEETVSARLVVAADGRHSPARRWAGFDEHRDKDRLYLSGLLMDRFRAPEEAVFLVNNFGNGCASIIFPQGKGRTRVYFNQPVDGGRRLSGDGDVRAFIDGCVETGVPAEYFDGAMPAGPLATFEGADSWVDHPYGEGVALIGDAASSTDPSWGQGLSLTLRDVRVLRDALASDDDWDAAGHAYAVEHDRYFHVVHTVEDWMTQFFFDRTPEGHARREKAFPLVAQDPTRMPDTVFTGPDHEVSDEMRQRFFAEIA